MAHVVNTVVYLETFPFLDNANALVSGKVNADWTKKVKRNAATSAATATVTEDSDDAGYYTPSLTPDAVGDWTVHLLCTHNNYTYRFSESFDVVTADQADPAAALEGAEITVVSPISLTGDISVIAGDAASIPWTSSEWDDLTGETVTFQAYKLLTDSAVFASAKAVTKTRVGGASQTVTLALLGTDTDDFTPGIAYRYEVNSTAGTLASGTLSAREG